MSWMDDDLDATLDGRLVNVLCGNDYLGLRHHPALLCASNDATNQYGSGASEP